MTGTDRQLRYSTWLLGLTILLGLTAIGCEPGAASNAGVDGKLVAEQQERLFRDEEPEGAVTPLDLREQDESFTSGPVVLVGRVGGMPNPWPDTEKHFPWRQGEATLFLVDPATAAEFADHASEAGDDHSDCPFCARKAAQSTHAIAAVTFADPNGKPIAVSADQLLGVAEDDLIVVTGAGRMLSDGELLMVEADGVYLRK